MDNDVTRRHLCSDEYQKLLKTAYFKITDASSRFIESFWNLAGVFNTYIALLSKT